MPLYQRVKDYVLRNIDSGLWPVHYQIPAEAALVKVFKASRMTANRALRELANEGRVHRHPGLGSFVTDVRPKSELLTIRGIADEIVERGHVHSSRVHLLRSEMAPRALTDAFELPLGSCLSHRSSFTVKAASPSISRIATLIHASSRGTLRLILRGPRPTRSWPRSRRSRRRSIWSKPSLPNARACRLLKIKSTEPCLLLYRAARVEGGISSIAWLTYPGSRYRLGSKFKGDLGFTSWRTCW